MAGEDMSKMHVNIEKAFVRQSGLHCDFAQCGSGLPETVTVSDRFHHHSQLNRQPLEGCPCTDTAREESCPPPIFSPVGVSKKREISYAEDGIEWESCLSQSWSVPCRSQAAAHGCFG